MKLFRTRSVDSIVGPLSKIVAKLDAHAEKQNTAATRAADKASRLLIQSDAHVSEAARAAAARDKINSLIG